VLIQDIECKCSFIIICSYLCYETDKSSRAPDIFNLFLLYAGVKMFFVSGQGNVTTLSQPQTLHAFQFVNYKPGTTTGFVLHVVLG